MEQFYSKVRIIITAKTTAQAVHDLSVVKYVLRQDSSTKDILETQIIEETQSAPTLERTITVIFEPKKTTAEERERIRQGLVHLSTDKLEVLDANNWFRK